MTTEAPNEAEVSRITSAMANAVAALGAVDAVDVIEASFGAIVFMAKKLGDSPVDVLAHLLLSAADNDVSIAREALRLAALDRGLGNVEQGGPS